MKKIRVGIVGVGGRGRDIIKLSSEFEDVEIVAACDTKRYNWYETLWGFPAPMADLYPEARFYESYDQMLDQEQLDVMIVETGADIHAAFCIKALERNIHVFAEIPTVASLAEAEALWKAAEKSTAIISVGANPNYQKFCYLLQDFYKKGLLGKPYCMEAEYIHWYLPTDVWSKRLSMNGNWRKLLIPIRYCTHSLGPLLTVVEEPLRYCSCFGTGYHSDDPTDFKKDDMMCAQFKTESGIVIRIMKNGRCRADIGHHNYRVFGTEGYMERIDRFEKPVIRYNSQKELDTGLKEISGEYMPPAYKDNEKAKGHGGMDYAMLDHFYKAIREGGEAPISLKAGLEMTLPGIYAEESAKRNGKVLYMRYPWDEDWTTEID